jgi:hypothetical protein
MQYAPALGHKYYSVYASRENYGGASAVRKYSGLSRGESMINKSNRRARQIDMIVICCDFHVCRSQREWSAVADGKRGLAN